MKGEKEHSKKQNKIVTQQKSLDNFFILTGLVIILVTSAIYFKSLDNQFTNWDDKDYITINKDIRTLHNDSIGYTLKNTFTSYVMGNYHPITMLSYGLEYHCFKLNPKPYHITNLIFHILNSLLVFSFIWLLTKQKWTSFFTSILFAIHPMHVESVAWISERKDLLYTFFLLITICCYLRYSNSKKKKTLLYLITIIMFLLAVLSKAMAVTIPFVFILIDYFKDGKITLKTFIEKTPFFIGSVLFGIIAIAAQKSSNSIGDLGYHTIFEKILFSCYGIVMYLWKLLFPISLSCYYPYPLKSGGMYPAIIYISPIIIVVLSFLIFKSLKYGKEILFGFLFFIITILLVLQILPVGGSVIAERYTYIPYIGIFYIIALFLNNLLENKIKQLIPFKIPILLAFAFICLTYSVISVQRTEIWKNSISLWTNVIEKYEVAPEWVQTNLRISYNERADEYLNAGSYEMAIADYNNYIHFKNNNSTVYNKRGICYYKLKKYNEAIIDFNLAIKYFPKYPEAFFNRGLIYFETGQLEKSLNDFTSALELKPDYADAYYNRGIVYNDIHRYYEAIHDYTNALKYQPDQSNVIYNRSGAYYLTQQYKLALVDALRAKELGFPVESAYTEQLLKLVNDFTN